MNRFLTMAAALALVSVCMPTQAGVTQAGFTVSASIGAAPGAFSATTVTDSVGQIIAQATSGAGLGGTGVSQSDAAAIFSSITSGSIQLPANLTPAQRARAQALLQSIQAKAQQLGVSG